MHAASTSRVPPVTLSRALVLVEIGLVLGLSLGRSGVYALVRLIEAATAPGRLSSSTAVMNSSLAPGREWFDLTFQLLGIGFGLVPVALAAYLLVRSDTNPWSVWVGDRGAGLGRRIGVDALWGAGVAAVVGSTGIAFYLITHALGINLTVIPEALPGVWWKIPVLVGWALENALLEEAVVLGFVQLRLRQIGLSVPAAIGLSAVLRGPITSTRAGAASPATSSWGCSSAGSTTAGAGSRPGRRAPAPRRGCVRRLCPAGAARVVAAGVSGGGVAVGRDGSPR
ncbi:MAG: hypothetical protein U0R78_18125 [Nocardioidaceae bacterium]